MKYSYLGNNYDDHYTKKKKNSPLSPKNHLATPFSLCALGVIFFSHSHLERGCRDPDCIVM